jgi:serine/threonine protein kinase
MPADNKLYLCFEYCEFDLKKYMKSQQYKLSAESIKARSPSCFPPARVHVPRPSAVWGEAMRAPHTPMRASAAAQSFTYQMLNGLTWCHSHRIFHRCAAFEAAFKNISRQFAC